MMIILHLHYTALLRQTNPNWRVFFHLAPAEGSSATLPSGDGLEQRVQDMLDRFGDVRLKVLSGSAPVSLTTTSLPAAPSSLWLLFSFRSLFPF
jgi:hypothetical protein